MRTRIPWPAVALVMGTLWPAGAAAAPAGQQLRCGDTIASLQPVAPVYDASFLPAEGLLQMAPTAPASPAHDGWNTAELSITGPELGAMDQMAPQASLTCLQGQPGISIVLTIIRSANYQGAVLKNTIWRPKLLLHLSAKRTALLLRLAWQIRLSNDVPLRAAAVPGGSAMAYPLQSQHWIHLGKH